MAVLAAFAWPACALAVSHDSYVDQGTGADASNNCADPANPCKTIVRGIAQAGAGKTIFVAGGHTYTASLTLQDGKSLVHKNFGGASGEAILNNGAAATDPAVLATGTGGGTVKGFTIRSGHLPFDTHVPVTVTDDVFDESGQIPEEIQLTSAGGGATIKDSTFVDPTPLGGGPGNIQEGIRVTPGASGGTRITGNSFNGFTEAVHEFGDGPTTLRDNDVSGTHDTNGGGVGFDLRNGKLTLVANRLHDADTSAGSIEGILIAPDNGGLVPGGVSLRRNEVSDYEFGIDVGETSGAVRLDSDLLFDNKGYGLFVRENSDDPGIDARVTNLTSWNPDSLGDVTLANSEVSLDSSIVGPAGISSAGSTCSIAHSRGPQKHAGGDGCEDFQTTAGPRFRDAGHGNFHLKSSSPMIDAGNPTPPPAGSEDIDGDKRALDGPDGGNCHGNPRRDIGADEFHC